MHIRQRTTTYREERPHSPSLSVFLRLEYISFLLCVLFLCSLLLTLTVFHSVDTHSHTHAQKKNPRNYSDLRPQSSQVFLLPSTIAVSLCCISTFQSFLTVPSFRIRRLLSSIFVGFFFFDKLYCTVFRLRSVKFVVFWRFRFVLIVECSSWIR